MSGIGTEIRVFCYAILTGVLIVAVYLWIRVLRRLVAHRLWLINLEDVLIAHSKPLHIVLRQPRWQ